MITAAASAYMVGKGVKSHEESPSRAILVVGDSGQILMSNLLANLLLETGAGGAIVGANLNPLFSEKFHFQGDDPDWLAFLSGIACEGGRREMLLEPEPGFEIQCDLSVECLHNGHDAIFLVAIEERAGMIQRYLACRNETPCATEFSIDRGPAHEPPRCMSDQTPASRIIQDFNSQQLTLKLLMQQESLKHKFARDLHDQIGQHLVAMRMGLQAAKEGLDCNSLRFKNLEKLREQVDVIGQEVRQIALELRPTSLEDLGLVSALLNYCDLWQARSGVKIHFTANGFDEERLPREIETVIYRVIQESLTNIFKHAEARNVSVALIRSLNQVLSVVEDDGHGFETRLAFDPASNRDHLGLIGMRERLTLIGGNLIVESTPGQGTCVVARIPLVSSLQERIEICQA